MSDDLFRKRHLEALTTLTGLPGSDPELSALTDNAAEFRAMADLLYTCDEARYIEPAITIRPITEGVR
ncbi:hypothetical protein [Jongsikchunia kroppenstedtii]|uniref:hypothetical protein n=1 Tax=Jongsikchunia kroppenstedtii TaxID=1121721 RepID=UPI0003704E84|nr:hypothetical protein [Jongsikchunia kroppenstedtii]